MAVSMTAGVLAPSLRDGNADRMATVEPGTADALRQIRQARFKLILVTEKGARLGLRTARLSDLFAARIPPPGSDRTGFFDRLVTVAERPPERIIHVDTDYAVVLTAVEHGIRAVLVDGRTDPYRPLPSGAAYARSIATVPQVLIHLTVAGLDASGPGGAFRTP